MPKTGIVAGVYVQAISAYAPHPNAAKLWMEHLYSDEGQLVWLKGYCHPIRFHDLVKHGKVPQELLAKLPPADPMRRRCSRPSSSRARPRRSSPSSGTTWSAPTFSSAILLPRRTPRNQSAPFSFGGQRSHIRRRWRRASSVCSSRRLAVITARFDHPQKRLSHYHRIVFQRGVREGYDADQPLIAIHHRHAAHLVLAHVGDDVVDILVIEALFDVAGHDFGDRRVRALASATRAPRCRGR